MAIKIVAPFIRVKFLTNEEFEKADLGEAAWNDVFHLVLHRMERNNSKAAK